MFLSSCRALPRPDRCRDMFDTIRLHAWWRYKISPVLATVYLAMSESPYHDVVSHAVLAVAVFLVACLGIGGIGHVLTDAFDVAEDRRIGKLNRWATLSGGRRAALCSTLVSATVLPWLWLPHTPLVPWLVALEILLLAAYAIPPLRLKERGLPGIVADAAYAHVVPVLVAWFTFIDPAVLTSVQLTPWMLALWMLPMGMRHLARHQHDDLDRDRLAGVRTFAARAGREPTIRFVADRLLPVEFFLTLAALFWLTTTSTIFLVGFVAHAAWELHVVRRRWLAPVAGFRHLGPTGRHDLVGQRILSGYVETWVAPLALVSLIAHKPGAIWLLPLHLAVMRAPFFAWWRSARSLPRFVG